MQPTEAYKAFLPFAVVVLLLGLGFIVWKWPGSKDLTFSQHVARRRSSIIYYILLFTVALPPLNLFFIGWFVPVFKLSDWFIVFTLAASVMQYAVTLIPETEGWKTTYHRFLATCSATCLGPSIVIIMLANTVSSAGRVVAGIAFLIMASSAFAGLRNGGKHKYLLLLQSAYYAAFFLAILVATYWR